jgi:hypothetical protein
MAKATCAQFGIARQDQGQVKSRGVLLSPDTTEDDYRESRAGFQGPIGG